MATYEEFTIDQGADAAIEIHLVNPNGSAKDLTNHTIAAKMKRTFNSDSDDTTTFSSIVASPATDGVATLTGGSITGLESLSISVNNSSTSPNISINQSSDSNNRPHLKVLSF